LPRPRSRIPLAFEIFRAGYYGTLGAAAGAREERSGPTGTRWAYLVDFVAPFALWIPCLASPVARYAASRRKIFVGRDRVIVLAPIVGV